MHSNADDIFERPFDAIEKIAPSVWWNDFEVNTRGAFLVNAAFLRLTKETPSVRPTVVNVVSNVGFAPPHLSSYFSSKVAVMKFTEILQAENPELAAYTLNPGIVNTDITFEEFKPYAKDSRTSPVHDVLKMCLLIYWTDSEPGRFCDDLSIREKTGLPERSSSSGQLGHRGARGEEGGD